MASNSQFSDVDEYGFRRAENFNYNVYEEFMSSYLKVLARRRQKWETLIRKNIDLTKLNTKLKRFIRKGIPGPFRAEVWMKISGAYKLQKRSPELYQNLLKMHFNKEISDSIKIDLPRTFPDNIYFETKKERLYNVLIAYANHNREVGYCQGLNYIAGLLIIVTDNEETTFWLLKVIVENIVPSYHTKNMINLLRDLEVFKELINNRVPDVQRHIDNLGLPYAVIASKWFICMYAEVLPVETVLRIWDCVFSEGYKILFRVGLTIMVINQNRILETDDISTLASLFRDEIIQNELVTNCHNFIEQIFQVPGNLKRRQIEILRRKHAELLKKNKS